MEALYQTLDPERVRFFSCDFWNGNQLQCDGYQNFTGTSFPVLMNASVLGAPDQYNCSYHYVFVIDGDGNVAYRGSWNPFAIELVVADALDRLDDVQVSVGDVPDATVQLGAAFPNPFNPSTTVPFFVPEQLGTAHVQLDVLDLRGRVVRTLLAAQRPAGSHQILFDGRDDAGSVLPSGAYLARLRVAGQESSRMLSLVK